MTKTIDQLITEDFFFTLPYYCNAPESYMRQKIKELFAKWLKEELSSVSKSTKTASEEYVDACHEIEKQKQEEKKQ